MVVAPAGGRASKVIGIPATGGSAPADVQPTSRARTVTVWPAVTIPPGTVTVVSLLAAWTMKRRQGSPAESYMIHGPTSSRWYGYVSVAAHAGMLPAAPWSAMVCCSVPSGLATSRCSSPLSGPGNANEISLVVPGAAGGRVWMPSGSVRPSIRHGRSCQSAAAAGAAGTASNPASNEPVIRLPNAIARMHPPGWDRPGAARIAGPGGLSGMAGGLPSRRSRVRLAREVYLA